MLQLHNSKGVWGDNYPEGRSSPAISGCAGVASPVLELSVLSNIERLGTAAIPSLFQVAVLFSEALAVFNPSSQGLLLLGGSQGRGMEIGATVKRSGRWFIWTSAGNRLL